MRHLFDALGRDAPAAQHVGQERPDVGGPAGPPKDTTRTASKLGWARGKTRIL